MADRHTKEQRRKNMQAVKNKDSNIELILRKALWKAGVRYRKNVKDVLGKPDIAIKKHKIAVFCDSEFWHGYNWEERKNDFKSNQDFWIPKIERNMQRDEEVNSALEKYGWKVIRFWGKEIKKYTGKCVEIILEEIEMSKGKQID
jgi:DNA mismatch endonuclease, patch repair protein